MREANVTAALYDVSLFLFKVPEVSFDRTLVAEPTPETLFENHRLPPQSESAFQFGISRHLLGAELSKTSSSGTVPSGLEGNILKCYSVHVGSCNL